MRVRAKGASDGKPAGFYGTALRYNGEEFDLVEREDGKGGKITVEKQFSKKWMVKVEPAKKSVSK